MKSIVRRFTVVGILGANLWLGGCVVPGDYSGGSTVYVPTPVVVPRYRTVYVPRPVYVPRYTYYPLYPVPGYYPQSGLRVR
jgi:hypothetical protein